MPVGTNLEQLQAGLSILGWAFDMGSDTVTLDI
jgi:hypothetical protein